MIEGTAELPDIYTLARSLEPDPRFGAPWELYPQLLADLSPERLRELGELYLERTRIQRKTDRPLFIDKMPNNWAHAGFIKLILPNAKIVDVRRAAACLRLLQLQAALCARARIFVRSQSLRKALSRLCSPPGSFRRRRAWR